MIPRVRPAVHQMDIEGDKVREQLACLARRRRRESRTAQVDREQNRRCSHAEVGFRWFSVTPVIPTVRRQFFCLMSYFTCFLK